MIMGIGTDIVEIQRIKKACMDNPRFKLRVFTEGERAYALQGEKTNYSSLAAMWAAKEAYAKATGKGFRGFGFRDVEVCRSNLGAPYLKLHNQAAAYADQKSVHLSLSHSDLSAIAFCIIES